MNAPALPSSRLLLAGSIVTLATLSGLHDRQLRRVASIKKTRRWRDGTKTVLALAIRYD